VTVTAARDRWRGRLKVSSVADPKKLRVSPLNVTDIEDEIDDVVQAFDEKQRTKTLLAPWTFGDVTEATIALSLVVAPFVLRLYQHAWQETEHMRGMPAFEAPLRAVQQAARSHVTTTQDALRAGLAKLPEDVPIQELEAVVNKVFDHAAIRARELAETEAHRAVQAGRLAAWETAGMARWGLWRTAEDEKVCGWCGPLDGRRVPLGDMFFHRGDTVQDAAGKVLKLEYADVQTPPLQVFCRCTLEAE
jgi:hypothetical protein